MKAVAAVLLLNLSCLSQVQVSPLPGTQTNSPNATLTANGTHAGVPWSALSQGSSSENLGTSFFIGGVLPIQGPALDITLNLSGQPQTALALFLSFEPSTFQCPVPGPPCFTSTYLPGSIFTPAGTYHLLLPPTPVFDGIGLGLGGSLSITTGPTGTLSLAGSVPWSFTSATLSPTNFALQGVMADPTAPLGLRFTGTLTVARWLEVCTLCP